MAHLIHLGRPRPCISSMAPRPATVYHPSPDSDWEYHPAYQYQHQRLNRKHRLSFPDRSQQHRRHQLWQRQDLYHAYADRPPVVTTNPRTLVASFSATLNGSLDPHGLTTSVHFQYGTTTSYGLTTAPQSQMEIRTGTSAPTSVA